MLGFVFLLIFDGLYHGKLPPSFTTIKPLRFLGSQNFPSHGGESEIQEHVNGKVINHEAK